jgi:hypothetical protein
MRPDKSKEFHRFRVFQGQFSYRFTLAEGRELQLENA